MDNEIFVPDQANLDEILDQELGEDRLGGSGNGLISSYEHMVQQKVAEYVSAAQVSPKDISFFFFTRLPHCNSNFKQIH